MPKLESHLTAIRDAVCDRFLFVASVAGLPLVGISCYRAVDIGWKPAMTAYVAIWACNLLALLLRQSLSHRAKGVYIIAMLLAVGFGGLVQFGLMAASVVFLAAPPLFAAVLFGGRAAWRTMILMVAGLCAIAAAAMTASAGPGLDLAAYMTAPASWGNHIGAVAMVAGGLAFTFHGYAKALLAALDKALASDVAANRSMDELRSAESKAKQAQKVALVALADLAEHRDTDTGEHVLRVARMSHEIARTLMRRGYEPAACTLDMLQHIGIASILHDVGKVAIPDAVLLKPGKLTPEEREVMQQHAAAGGAILDKAARMLPDSLHFKLAKDIASDHHEHWDGSGYPRGLRGTEIPLAARIVAIADVHDALTSPRPYKAPWPTDKVHAFILERDGTQFDPAVVDAFFTVLDSRERANAVEWSDAISLNHPMVDQDHRILLQLINQIASVENANDPAAIGFVLDELVNYTHFHFAREERLLEEADYPDLEGHRLIHAAMIAEVETLQARFINGQEDVSGELSQYLAMWLVNHIMSEDRQYLPYVDELAA